MVCCFCCLPGEEALARPPLIEAQSAVDEAHEVPRHAKDTQLPQEPVPGACYTVGVDVDPYGTPLGITFAPRFKKTAQGKKQNEPAQREIWTG
ncbi:unnamed protein product [Effrenium voratum]|nr:unnamed protein product [Effrenium voratum]